MSRVIEAFAQFFDNDGAPLVDGWLKFLVSGSNNTNKNTYADVNESVANANPLQLDASGRCPNVFGTGAYRVISYTNDPVLDTPDTQIQQFDPVEGYASISGFAPWDSQTVYDIPDIVTGSDLELYRSIINDNIGNDPTLSDDYWEQVEFEQVYNENKTYSQYDRCIDASGNSYTSLVSNNKGNTPSTSPDKWLKAGVRSETPDMTVYDSSGTYTKPSDLAAIIVDVVGGGGGGGGVNGGVGGWGAGAGGAAGGHSRKYILASDLGATETMTVGTGGAGGAAGSYNGADGLTTSFGSHLQATGGKGGVGNIAQAVQYLSNGSAGGIGSGGDINSEGGRGEGAIGIGFGALRSGNGGMSFFGEGGGARIGQNPGFDAATYGAGGSGGSSDNIATDYAGGDGADGVIVVYEYFNPV
jgi:hypothetical protein